MRGESMKDKSKKSTYSTTFGVDPSTTFGVDPTTSDVERLSFICRANMYRTIQL